MEKFLERMKKRLKKWFRLRFAIFYPFALWAVFGCNFSDVSFAIGMPFIIVGEFIRVWANGYVIKAGKLTTSGPYAFVRNPLYLGTIILSMGFLIALRMWVVIPVFIVCMVIAYYRKMKCEDGELYTIFKDEYLVYKKNVPSMIPRITPYQDGEKWGFNFKRFIFSEEYKVVLWIIIGSILFYLKKEFMVEHNTMELKHYSVITVAVVLALTDLIGEYFLRRSKRNMAGL
jgi:protein-S-isoprenylcysteine O-methyltransferase Ste14